MNIPGIKSVWLSSLATRRILFKLIFLATAGLLTIACAAFPLVVAALPSATPNPHQPGNPTATFTPTPVIGAVEIQPTASPTPGSGGVLWKGTISSTTRRQYNHNGQTLETCETDWTTTLYFVVSQDGSLHGNGEADLNAPASCSPSPRPANTEKMTLNLDGKADQSAINLKIGTVSFTPNPSGDFGGYASLTTEAVCQGVLRSLAIPMTGSDTASAQLSLTGNMTGCGGSSTDVMTSDNQIKLNRIGDCASLPADEQSGPGAKLCGLAGS